MIAFLTIIPSNLGLSATYYVATNGNDRYDGLHPAKQIGMNGPFETIQRAANALKPGDNLYIRGGIYSEKVIFTASGTETKPIKVMNHRNEMVIVDGNKIRGGIDDPLLHVIGNWYFIKNLEIRRSSGPGIQATGANCTVDSLYVHHNWGSGIVLTGIYNTAQNCQVWSNSMINENGQSADGWGFGISCCRYPAHCIIRNCKVWDNWGEGVSTFEAMHTQIKDNIVYNNMNNVYISDTKHSVLQRNLIYCTQGNPIAKYYTQNGILVGDEKGIPIPLGYKGIRNKSSDNKIMNNLVMGCDRNLAAGVIESTNNLYANNTLVNASKEFNVLFYKGITFNARFINNIILQENNVPIALIAGTGITLSNNNWSRVPPFAASGRGDIIGDPRLAKKGPSHAGAVTPDYFRILKNSPARSKGKVLMEVEGDFFQCPRGPAPDIGAHEYGGGCMPDSSISLKVINGY
jgi:hypothetical protein